MDSEFHVEKVEEYEYIIYAKNLENNQELTWIIVDGIAEERKIHTLKKELDHPVFQIECMSDIYKDEVSTTQSFHRD
jgi:hypothetical protein